MPQAARRRLSGRELLEYVADVEGHDSQVTGRVRSCLAAGFQVVEELTLRLRWAPLAADRCDLAVADQRAAESKGVRA